MRHLLRSLIIVLLSVPGIGAAAHAALPEVPAAVRAALPDRACGADPDVLVATRRQIADAGTLAQARERAVQTPRLAKRAIRVARRLAPWNAELGEALERIEAYERRVEAAETPDEVAWEFGEFVQLASVGSPLLADVEIDVEGGGCDYSTGEIIAIVLGFLLGIIPGIILLILLC